MDGCGSDRMGSPHGQSSGFRWMDSSTTNFAYQYARNESCRARSPLFPTSVTRETFKAVLRCDNSTIVAYINKQGGGGEIPCTLSVYLGWISVGRTESNLFTSSTHSGEKEYFSRRLVEGSTRCESDRVERTPRSCGYVVSEASTSQHRLVCTRENKKLPILFSPYPDQAAWASDTLSVSWSGMHAYELPPPILIPQVLMKVRQELFVMLLVAPFSPRRSWHPLLFELPVDFPRALWISRNMLTQRRGQIIHQDPESLHLVA